ncbi:MAG: hypothetical protein IJN93_02880 [Clostridia bacterium]|nr:hypothetical protein [Clostridia bacterium]
MKKLLALLLAFVCIFCFVGCKSTEEQEKDDVVSNLYNLNEYISSGKIPEAEFTIGTSVQSIKDKYAHADEEESNDGHYHAEIYEIEGNKSDALQVGEIMYYYEKGADKVSSIVCLVSGFGFEVSELTGKNDIIKAFPSYKYTTRDVASSELYFIPGELENCTAITYQEGSRRLDFFFQEDNLIGINLVDTESWTLT